MRAPRRVAALAGMLLVVPLAACAPPLPDSVVPDTAATAAWAGELTSFNPLAAPTSGNLDVAAATRARFGDVVDGEFVADESFGTVSIVGDDPFTVRYDLAEPAWSDGIPLDAADLMLGWAFAAGLLAADPVAGGEDAGAGTDAGADAALPVVDPDRPPVLDEFARAIDVTFTAPSLVWQSAVTAVVPAHLVGELAFDLDDPMEAKQAVIRAIEDGDAAALAKIADAWAHGFDVADDDGYDGDLAISSGPYRVDGVSRDGDGQSVVLAPNAQYRGSAAPQIARVTLAPPGTEPLAALGESLDVVSTAPTAENAAPIRELERRDAVVQTTNDGRVWSILARSAGVFASPSARAAFLRAAPATDMVDRGGGEWASAYTKTTSMLALPNARSIGVVTEDSGFTAALGTPADDAAIDRAAAGVGAGAVVCVLYDRGSAFAAGAFAALRDTAAEAGWSVADCGSDDVAAALTQNGWDAAIVPVAVPQTPAQLSDTWGSGSASTPNIAAVLGVTDAARDALIAQYAQTTDVYEARELLAQIEATIVNAAVARPLATNPVVTVTAPRVTGVTVRDGALATLTPGIAQWAVVG